MVFQCIFYALDKVEEADATHLFTAIDQLKYDHLVGLGTDGCNVMMGARNSVLSRLRLQQPNKVSIDDKANYLALNEVFVGHSTAQYIEETRWFFNNYDEQKCKHIVLHLLKFLALAVEAVLVLCC